MKAGEGWRQPRKVKYCRDCNHQKFDAVGERVGHCNMFNRGLLYFVGWQRCEECMEPTKITRTTVTKTVCQQFSYEALRVALGLPEGVEIWVTIPTGGDYSGENLNIDVDTDLFIQYETVECSEKPE